MRITSIQAAQARASSQSGFTMIIALGVMLVTSLLLVAAFTAADGDIHLSHVNSVQKQAYYAALAGIQEYEYQLENNPDYWETCASPANTVPQEANERYEIKLLVASSAPSTLKACSTSSPFESMIESTGSAANTFRIESTGCAGLANLTTCENQPHSTVAKRSIVATFQVVGFLNFVYFTNLETEDPGLYEPSSSWKCEKYYGERSSECVSIEFTSGDEVKGPMHTNDAVDVCGSASFGRKGHNPPDVIEFFRGLQSIGCSGATYYTASKSYIKGSSLIPPQSDESLGSYVEKENEFTGVTHLELNGTANTITVFNAGLSGGKETLPWPENGLIWVKSSSSSSACGYKYIPDNSDNKNETSSETNCGTAYVQGTYSKSLTIGTDDDLIINNNIYPTSVAGKLGTVPTGTATLGLIANNYVRVYHPVGETYTRSGSKCKENNYGSQSHPRIIKDPETSPNSGICEYTNEIAHFGTEEVQACDAPNASGSLSGPWIYAANLSTRHSWAVDNFFCGEELGNLNVYGVIAQNYRGIVGTGAGTGYIKNYNYDQRLAVDEPPYFLSPLKAGWKVARETAPTEG
jgi:hypothetical protein